MAIDGEFREYRLAIIRELEEEYRKAEEQQAQLDAKKREINQKRVRMERDLPDKYTCPECFYEHDRISTLIPQPSGARMDLFRCGTCGYEKEIGP